MVWNESTRPNDHCVGTTSVFRNIFYASETPSFTLAGVSGAYAATTWFIRNYYGTTVASGVLSGSSLTLSGPLPLGWYKLHFVRPSAASSPWLTAGGEVFFCVVRSGGSLTARPAQSTLRTPSGGDPRTEGMDYPARGVMGLGPHRHSVYLDDTWYASSKTAMEVGAPNAASFWATDSARPLRQMVGFPEGTGGASPTGTQTSRIQAVTTSAVTNGTPWLEGRNEPQVDTTYTNYYPELQAFANTVHGASGSASVMAPCPIYVHGGPGSDNGLAWVDGLLGLGGGTYLDVFSFHNYNSGDLPSSRKVLDALVAVLTTHSQHNKPRYISEFSSRFAAVYGSWEHRLQTQKGMFDLHMAEQYKIPKEQTSFFYDWSHGFWDFPSWFMSNENQTNPNPLVATVRVWSEELFGKNFAAKLDFGTVENDHFLGSRFDHPSNGTKTVVLASDGRAGTVSLSVTGASSLTWVDPWGNTASKTVTGGLAAFDVDTLPIYVRLASGVTAVPAIANYGIEVIRAQIYSVATANTLSSTALLGINGVIGTVDTIHETSNIYQGTEGTAPPSWFQVDLPTDTRLDTVVVHCPEPWQHDSSLLNFDVQTWDGAAWVTQASVSEPAATYQWTSTKSCGACFTDSYYSRRHVWVVRFAVVATTKLRVYATDYTYGGGATEDTTDGAGLAGGATGQTSPRHISIRQVQAFLSEGANGPVHGEKYLVGPRAGAPPAAPVSDTFNRANSGTLGTATTGQTWSEADGDWEILGNRAHPLDFNNYNVALIETTMTEMDAKAQMFHSGWFQWCGVIAGAIDVNNFYWVEAANGAEMILWRRYAGSDSELTRVTVAYADSQMLHLVTEDEGGDTRLRVSIDSTQIISVLDSIANRPQGGTKAGMYSLSTWFANANDLVQFDNFSVTAP